MKKRKGVLSNILLTLLVPLLMLAPASSALSENPAALPVTHGSIVRDYARITFEWPKPVLFTADAKGKTVTLTFDREANPDFSPMLAQLSPYVTHAQQGKNNKTVVLTLDKPYRIRTFVSDNISGIDLLDIDPAAHSAAPKVASAATFAALAPAAGEDTAPAKPAQESPAVLAAKPAAEAKPVEAPKPPVVPEKPAAEVTKPVEAQKPAAVEAPAEKPAIEAKPAVTAEKPAAEVKPAEAPKPPVVPEKPVEAQKPAVVEAPATEVAKPAAETKPVEAPKLAAAESAVAAPVAPAPEAKPLEAAKPAPDTAKPATETKPAEAAKPAASDVPATPKVLDDSSALPPAEAVLRAATEAAANHTVKVGVSAAADNAVLRFSFSERVAMAVFVRADMLWIVINKKTPLDLTDFDALPPTVIGKAQPVADMKMTVLRIPIDDNLYVNVAREEGSFEWAILLTPKNRPLTGPLKVSINTDPPAAPHVFVSVLEMADPVMLRDPDVGDELAVIPTFNAGEGIATRRDFVEFTLPQTAQGIVVTKKADDVTVEPSRNGLRIATPGGTVLTPGLPDVAKAAPVEVAQTSTTMFPYQQWKFNVASDRRQVIRELQHRIVESEHIQDSNEARLRLAQLYLSEGLAPEALAQLDSINRTNPVFYRSAKLAALRGAANFLMYRFSEAARDFSASELNNNKEADFWRGMLSDLLGNPEDYDYLALNEDYISKYPPIFRQRLAIVAADRSIDGKEYNVALKIFDTLHQENLLQPINAYVNFLLAKVSSSTGQEQEASDAWDKLAVDYDHPFVRARADFSRIVWGMDHDSLTKDEAIERLERLRLSWRGDNLELQVLKLLGELYTERKDYVNAMRVWDDGVQSFPNTSIAIDMAHKMEDAFVLMFNEGNVDSLPTLDALALYYQYRNYAPPGNSGAEMTNRLADRLVAVDLLDQAALLIEHQMRFQAEKEQRSQSGVRLATVQLLNHQPKKALQALEDSVYGENPILLRVLRNRLAAQALSELGQYDRALDILGADDSADAEHIRLGIYWARKDWTALISSVESLLKTRKDITAALTLDESEGVLKLALAYVFQNDTVQLQYLRDYFGPLMANNPNKPVFDFITAPDIRLTSKNFDDVIKSLSTTQSFLEHYRARIKAEGLGAVAGPKGTDKTPAAASPAPAKGPEKSVAVPPTAPAKGK